MDIQRRRLSLTFRPFESLPQQGLVAVVLWLTTLHCVPAESEVFSASGSLWIARQTPAVSVNLNRRRREAIRDPLRKDLIAGRFVKRIRAIACIPADLLPISPPIMLQNAQLEAVRYRATLG